LSSGGVRITIRVLVYRRYQIEVQLFCLLDLLLVYTLLILCMSYFSVTDRSVDYYVLVSKMDSRCSALLC
jgi:hypothetical protein